MNTTSTMKLAETDQHKINKLSKLLKKSISGEIRFSEGDRALYATDSSNYRQPPIGIVLPKTKEDIVTTIKACKEFGIPVLGRGTGTSLAGQTTNAAVIIDCSKYYNKILHINPKEKTAIVQPGCVLDDLQQAAEPHQLVFGPDPSTHHSCSLGGMIGNNACGVHSVLAADKADGARTSDNVISMEIITADGDIFQTGVTDEKEIDQLIKNNGKQGEKYAQMKKLRDEYQDLIREKFPKIPRRVSGYNLDDLLPEKGFNVARALAGSEGTLGFISEVKLQLVDKSKFITMAVIGFKDVYVAGDYVKKVMEYHPEACEGMDEVLINLMKRKQLHTSYLRELPEGNGWLMLEFGGKTRKEATDKAKKLADDIKKDKEVLDIRIFEDDETQGHIWLMRESGLGVTAHVPGQKDSWEGWEDSAAPPEKMGDYMRELRKLYEKYNYHGTFYGHFGQGIVHTRIDFGLKSKEGVAQFRSFIKEASELVTSFGGSLSGEHGDGQSRAEMLEIMYGKELVQAFEQFKKIWDPENLFNPHKVVFPYRIDQNLRYGPNYNPPQLKTKFSYPEDNNSFAYAMERCVGVGKCRKTDTGTMCPSYMVTKEEKHSTRGRSRLLFEMVQGQVIGKKGWKDKNVHEALSLCLACKACKSECPVNVDMATYKAEFRYHYYKNRLKPATAYSMGLIDMWARVASKIPGIANFFTQTPPFSTIIKKLAGIASKRQMPKFAKKTFRQHFFSKKRYATDKPKVILWADTFNNYLLPQTAIAAVEVLEYAGYEVMVPAKHLCCGRPLYDFGMLKRAKSYLQEILDFLAPEIEAGIPIVGLEPSCVSVFKEEMLNFFPGHENARRLAANITMLSEFLAKEGLEDKMPKLKAKAKLHQHCHHKSVLNNEGELKLMQNIGLDLHQIDSGCCGMAGSFGFEKENYEVSLACGERRLKPEVESADKDTLIIADGFSCREQIKDMSNINALHTAEVLQLAINNLKKQ